MSGVPPARISSTPASDGVSVLSGGKRAIMTVRPLSHPLRFAESDDIYLAYCTPPAFDSARELQAAIRASDTAASGAERLTPFSPVSPLLTPIAAVESGYSSWSDDQVSELRADVTTLRAQLGTVEVSFYYYHCYYYF